MSALAISSISISAGPASAAEANLDDAQGLISSIAPELLLTDETVSNVKVEPGTTARGESTESPVVTVDAPVGGDFDLRVGIEYGGSGPAVTTQGISVLPGESDDVRSYVQATPGGVRFMTAIASASAPSSYTYGIDLPEGSKVSSRDDGTIRILDAAGILIGGFAPAWAEDSQGNQLPTHYEWADGTLIQHIDLSDPTIEFPVLADPYWGYSVSFSIGNTTPWQAWSALHGCFNCYFPIYGAPTACPAMYQVLPLRVGWGGTPLSLDFTCIMGYSAWSAPDNAAGWMFNAASSHVDGLGSWIAFDLVAYQLQVTAWIVNDFGPGGIGNNAYAAGAALTWQQFANNLTT